MNRSIGLLATALVLAAGFGVGSAQAASVEMTVKKLNGLYYGDISVDAQGATSATVAFPAYSAYSQIMDGDNGDFWLMSSPHASLSDVMNAMSGTIRISVKNGSQESILAYSFNPANLTESDFPIGSVSFTSPTSGSVDQPSNLMVTWALSGGLSGNDVDAVVLNRYGSGQDYFLSTMSGELTASDTSYAWTNLAVGSHTMEVHYANMLHDVAGSLTLEKNELGLALEVPGHMPGLAATDVLVAVMVSDQITFSVPEPSSLLGLAAASGLLVFCRR